MQVFGSRSVVIFSTVPSGPIMKDVGQPLNESAGVPLFASAIAPAYVCAQRRGATGFLSFAASFGSFFADAGTAASANRARTGATSAAVRVVSLIETSRVAPSRRACQPGDRPSRAPHG